MSDNNTLTAKMQDATLKELIDMVGEESLRAKPRPYVVNRIMSRIAKRLAPTLYKLPTTTPIRKRETQTQYLLRLIEITAQVEEA